MPRCIDIHAHINFAAYDEDRKEVVDRAVSNGIWMINVGTQQTTSQNAVTLAEEYSEGVYAIIGLHPIHTSKSYHDEKEIGEGGQEFNSRGEVFNPDFYRTLAQSKKVVGIGECGLDYFRTEPDSLERQRVAFRAQIELAIELDLPLMLHIRASKGSVDAYKDALVILRKYKEKAGERLRGDVHFFAGNSEIAKQFTAIGFYISFTGVITFARDYDSIIEELPLENILTETDCPYVTPTPYRGKRNEPIYVEEVVKKIAEIKKFPIETVRDQIVKNAQKLFRFV